MKYVELPHNKKLNLLNDHDGDWKNLEQTKWCMHCNKQFTGLSVRVYEQNGKLWLECGTPDCNGSPIDWAPFPWWDDKHPDTIEFRRTHQNGEGGFHWHDDEEGDDEDELGKPPF